MTPQRRMTDLTKQIPSHSAIIIMRRRSDRARARRYFGVYFKQNGDCVTIDTGILLNGPTLPQNLSDHE